MESDTSLIAYLGTGLVNIVGEMTVMRTVPSDYPVGPATLWLQDEDTGCGWGRPMQITQLTFNPGAGLTTMSTSTTSSTTTQMSPSTSSSAPSPTIEVVGSDPSSDTTEASGTTLVAGASARSGDGGTPWAVWITGSAVGILIGAAMMLAAIRKEIIKV